MPEKKICPIMSRDYECEEYVYCSKEKCAWWDEVEEKCAISLLGAESGLRLREHDEGRPWK